MLVIANVSVIIVCACYSECECDYCMCLLYQQEKDKVEEKRRHEMSGLPHFWNLNEDPQLTNMVTHVVKRGENRIGNKKATPPPDMLINGLSIQTNHAEVVNTNNDITLSPGSGAKILLNGEPLTGTVTLHHNDRWVWLYTP